MTNITKLIIGLGNPLPSLFKYRHNMGRRTSFHYMACHRDSFAPIKLAQVNGDNGWRMLDYPKRSPIDQIVAQTIPSSYLGKIMVPEHSSAAIMVPATFMNQSGRAVKAALDFTGLSPAEMLIISDDIEMDFGHIRFRGKGSAGGHNGLEDIIETLGTDKFPRLKIGARTSQMDTAHIYDFVLSNMTQPEEKRFRSIMDAAVQGIDIFLEYGVEKASGTFNGKEIE